MLLQEMLRDGQLNEYSCVIVDEVHERSVNVDLILGFLKQLIGERRKKKNLLKVVVMSATVDVEGLARFFSMSVGQIPAAEEQTNGNAASHNAVNGGDEAREEVTNDDETTNGSTLPPSDLSVTLCHVEGRQYPVKLHYLDRPTDDVIDAALQRIFTVHCREAMPGDILVFMTGQETIQGLQKLVEE